MSSREQFEIWGCSDRDLSITLKCETYAGIAWLAWQAAISAMEAKCAALAAENAGLRDYRPQPNGAAMMEALDAFYEYHEDVPEQGMMAAFEILCCKRPKTPATDSFLAEVRASAVDEVCLKISNAIVNCYQDEQVGLDSAATICGDFAAQLRKGASA